MLLSYVHTTRAHVLISITALCGNGTNPKPAWLPATREMDLWIAETNSKLEMLKDLSRLCLACKPILPGRGSTLDLDL